MYKQLIENINHVIEKHKNSSTTDEVTDRDEHYFIQGLEVAKQLIEQEMDLIQEELAYETYQELTHYFSGILDPIEFEEIVNSVQFVSEE